MKIVVKLLSNSGVKLELACLLNVLPFMFKK